MTHFDARGCGAHNSSRTPDLAQSRGSVTLNRPETTLLLTNDDGWDAPGLAALWQASEGLGRCRLVAPTGPISGCGHRVTTGAPIAIAAVGEDRIAVDGTPADCVRLALDHLAPGVDWVLSGINAGGNLGADVYHSGTVAAVREGVLHGVPGIALSHYIGSGRVIDWPRAARWAAEVLRRLLSMPPGPGAFWNVNFPHPGPDEPDPRIVFCPLDPSPLPLTYRVEEGRAVYVGNYHARARRPRGDVDVCFGGQIAVTLVRVFEAD
jgi:5'-nucleotidase